MNYIKSEFYRISHSSGIYKLTGLLAALAFLYNVLTSWFLNSFEPGSLYTTTSFSYSNLVANPMLYCIMAAVAAAVLYEGNVQNGNMKNTIAFGTPRTTIFIGKCVVSVVSSLFALLIILSVFIASTVIFMRKDGPVQLYHLLTEVPAVFFVAVAAMISMLIFMELFEKFSVGVILWCTIWFFIPKILLYMGMRFYVVYIIAMLLPANFFSADVMPVNTSECITAWDTPIAMARCNIIGMIGIVVFVIAGILLLRKKEC